MNFIYLVESLLNESKCTASSGIIFRTQGKKDIGCCIGIKHGKNIKLSKECVDRILKIPDLKFYAEGIAAKHPEKEPGMKKAMKDYFSDYKIEKKSWDEITEDNREGTANPDNNITYLFMQYEYNEMIDWFPYTKGTLLDAFARPKKRRGDYPVNAPGTSGSEERIKWIKKHFREAGFLEKAEKSYSREAMLELMHELERDVYPGNAQVPSATYFGKLQQNIEDERNKTIFNLMKEGGCCFAGSGHLVELKDRYQSLDFLCKENV